MIVLNLFGGPGAGKSTMAARVFSELKEKGYNCELVSEFAKDLTWQESMKVLDNQIYVFAKQHHRVWRLVDKVDIVVTDSPLLLSLVYGTTSKAFKTMVMEEYDKFQNVNIQLKRVKKYNPKGRNQSEEEAMRLDVQIDTMMHSVDQPFDLRVEGRKESADTIVQLIETLYANTKSTG